MYRRNNPNVWWMKKNMRSFHSGRVLTRNLSFDLLSGFDINIEHLDGHKVHIVRDKVTWPGARIRKKGEGMPNYYNNNLFGMLYITFDVQFPKEEFSSEDKEHLRRIFKQDSINKVYNGLRGFWKRKEKNEEKRKKW